MEIKTIIGESKLLRQIKDVRQSSREGHKQWYTSSEIDLFIWYDGATISAFHLIYDKSKVERALIWNRLGKTLHVTVEDGVRPGRYPSSPLMTDQAPFDKRGLLALLAAQTQDIDVSIEALLRKVVENFEE